MKSEREQILELLREEFGRWEEMLSSLSEEEIAASRLPNGWSIKDLMAHLMAWQQVTGARLEAALLDREPTYPEWLAGSSPESEEELHTFNARIHELHRDRPWSDVKRDWREGFLRILELGGELSEEDLLAEGQYPWLHGFPLIAILDGTYEHHHVEHWGKLSEWMERRARGTAGYGRVEE